MMNIFIVKRTPGHTESPGLALAQEAVGCGLWEPTLSGRMMSTSRVAPEKGELDLLHWFADFCTLTSHCAT